MRRTQLRTRPPTDDAVLPRHKTDPHRRHGGESAESMRVRGTLIHHAAARAIGPLMVAMIEAPFRALLVTPAGRTNAGSATLGSARRRTVGVSAITGGANPKGPSTRPARADTKRRLHEAAAPSARPRRSAATSCRMAATDSACRSVESVTRAWRSRSRSSRIAQPPHTLSQALPLAARHTTATVLRPATRLSKRLCDCLSLTVNGSVIWGGPFLVSNPGSILASAEDAGGLATKAK
jgi:hypothetical protein